MRLDLVNLDQTPFSRKFIEDAVDFIKSNLIEKNIISSAENRKLVLAFLDEESMIKLNVEFRKKNQVTDVLSFAPVEKGDLGELALCIPQIQKQADKEGLTLEEEAAYLILHGILHLLGYYHEEGGDAACLMYEIQDGIFKKWREQRKG